jgi:transposase-like protein
MRSDDAKKGKQLQQVAWCAVQLSAVCGPMLSTGCPLRGHKKWHTGLCTSSWQRLPQVTLERPRREVIQRLMALPVEALDQILDLHANELIQRVEAIRLKRRELRPPADVGDVEG